MAVTVSIASLDNVSAMPGDNYSVTVTLEMLDGVEVIDTKPVTVIGYRYEAANVKVAAKARITEVGKEWRNQYLKTLELVTEIGDINA